MIKGTSPISAGTRDASSKGVKAGYVEKLRELDKLVGG
jgi:hypothetical protein